MKKLTLLSIFAVAIAAVTVFGCRKSLRDSDTETQSTADDALAEFIFNDVYKQVFLAHVPDTTLSSLACDTSYFNPAFPDTTYPKTLTIRFDTVNGCTGVDGINRRGTITAVVSNDLGDSLSFATITFSKYYVNGNKISGSKILTNKGRNSSGKTVFSDKVYGATITRPDGEQVSWTSNYTRTWIQGDTTNLISDDVYTITGTASGTGISGNTFSVIINSALRVSMTCQYPTSGIITIQPANLLPRKVDFGGGGCDQDASIAIAGKTYDVTLP